MLKRKKKISYKKLLLLLVILIAIFFSLFQTFSFIKNSFFKSETQDTVIKNKVAKMLNTKGEDAKVYKIKDTQSIKDKNIFYTDIIEGDYVLVYVTSQKVLIYREKENMIINYSSSLGM